VTKFLENNQARAEGKYKRKFTNLSGQLLTKGLFDCEGAPFTLADHDKGSRLSLRAIYLEAEDLLEYEFAEEHLDGWKHWKSLLKCNWFKEHIEEWRDALDLKIRSRSLRALMDEASDPLNRGYVQANRYLLDKGYLATVSSAKRGVGRPKKEEPDTTFDISDRLTDDVNRILKGKAN